MLTALLTGVPFCRYPIINEIRVVGTGPRHVLAAEIYVGYEEDEGDDDQGDEGEDEDADADDADDEEEEDGKKKTTKRPQTKNRPQNKWNKFQQDNKGKGYSYVSNLALQRPLCGRSNPAHVRLAAQPFLSLFASAAVAAGAWSWPGALGLGLLLCRPQKMSQEYKKSKERNAWNTFQKANKGKGYSYVPNLALRQPLLWTQHACLVALPFFDPLRVSLLPLARAWS